MFPVIKIKVIVVDRSVVFVVVDRSVVLVVVDRSVVDLLYVVVVTMIVTDGGFDSYDG